MSSPTPEFGIEPSPFGPILVLKSAWSSLVEEAAHTHDIAGLYLNRALGWDGNDVSFVARLPRLKSLRIVDHEIQSVEAVNGLEQLHELQLSTYCKTRIDFTRLKHLEWVGMDWRTGCDGLFSLQSLRQLLLTNVPAAKLEGFAEMTELEYLVILGSRTPSLDPTRTMVRLKGLRIALMPKLLGNEFLENLVSLEDLWVQSCSGFASLEPLKRLRGLRTLGLESVGNVETLEPIRGLPALERVGLSERTSIVDGHMEVLRSLPSLRCAHFGNRRHYDSKCESFPNEVCRAWGDGSWRESA